MMGFAAGWGWGEWLALALIMLMFLAVVGGAAYMLWRSEEARGDAPDEEQDEGSRTGSGG